MKTTNLIISWQGAVSGPYTLDEIRNQLRSKQIHSLYKVQTDQGWIALRDFLGEMERPLTANIGQTSQASPIQPSLPRPAIPPPGNAAGNSNVKPRGVGQTAHGATTAIRPQHSEVEEPPASADSLRNLLALFGNPVGHLQSYHRSTGKGGALFTGIGLGMLNIICIVFAAAKMVPAFTEITSLDVFFKMLAGAFLPFVSFCGACAVVRMSSRGIGGFCEDVLIAGTALFPISVFLILASLLGMANIEVIFVIYVISLCVPIMILFTAYTRVYRISDRSATMAVPFTLFASAFIIKIIVSAYASSVFDEFGESVLENLI